MKCDIIIPIWNQPDYTKECIENIFRNTAYPYRLILIDNGSGPETKKYLQDLAGGIAISAPQKTEISLVRNEENLGFVKAVNKGLKITNAPYVCILNNDTIPAPGWLDRLIEFAQAHKDAGLLNPLCNGHMDTPIDAYAKMLYEKNKDKYMEMNQCQGFCMLIKREVMDKIGYLDESFGIGGFDDTDYSMRAGKAGYRCVCVYSSYVYHKQHVSFHAMGDRKRLVSKGEDAYFKKWPRHLRVGVTFSIDGDTTDAEVANMLESVLFMAREWCWVNLWVFGEKDENCKKIAAVSEKINMPLHQNIKFNALSDKYKNAHVLVRLIERAFGTKARKKYDFILVDDKKLFSLLKVFQLLHRTPVNFVEFKKDMRGDIGNSINTIRGIK